MALSLSTGLKNFALDSGMGTAFDSGTGRLAILTGSPVAAGSAQTGTLLATLTLPSDVFAAATSGGISLNAVSSVTAVASGTAASFCFYRTGDTAITSSAGSTDRRMTGSLGTSGTDMIIDTTSVVLGGTVAMSGWTFNHGG